MASKSFKMTKQEKREMFAPKRCALYENGVVCGIYDSRKAAKKARHFLRKEAYADMLDIDYEIVELKNRN